MRPISEIKAEGEPTDDSGHGRGNGGRGGVCFHRQSSYTQHNLRARRLPSHLILLDARRAAIEKAVEEMGGEKDKDGNESTMRGMLVMLARESAGYGFDEGVKYMASNEKS